MEAIHTKPISKNEAVLNGFYTQGKRFVTKDELIAGNFDFSEFFSTSELRQYFDVQENNFEYKDFVCGKFFVKTRDKDPNNPQNVQRLFFQIIQVDFSIISPVLKESLSLIRSRKFTAGTASAHKFDSEMASDEMAKKFESKYLATKTEIGNFLPTLKSLIANIKDTEHVLDDILGRLENESQEERWL